MLQGRAGVSRAIVPVPQKQILVVVMQRSPVQLSSDGSGTHPYPPAQVSQ